MSVPRLDALTAELHRDPEWLAARMELFHRYFAPSVGRLGVPAILLCSSASAGYVVDNTRGLNWLSVEVQDDWYGGWTGAPDQMVTRLDSDDSLREDWFKALDAAPPGFDAYCTKRFLRFDPKTRGLYERVRLEPASLAAFSAGRSPFDHDHKTLEEHYRTFDLPQSYLLQVVHGGNLSWRRPRWWHFRYRVPLERIKPFGLEV